MESYDSYIFSMSPKLNLLFLQNMVNYEITWAWDEVFQLGESEFKLCYLVCVIIYIFDNILKLME